VPLKISVAAAAGGPGGAASGRLLTVTAMPAPVCAPRSA
jgi:hypothetical protein